MNRIYSSGLESGVRAASTCVDLDGVQVLVTLFDVAGRATAEVTFRHHPGEAWSDPVRVTEDEER